MEQADKEARRKTLVLPLIIAACATMALLLLLISALGTRLHLWHFRTGFAILNFAAYSGVAIAIVSLVTGILAARKRHLLAVLISLVALTLALFAFGIPFSFKQKAERYPRIHDISTDLDNPPPFVALAPKRPDRLQYGGAAVAAEQMKAYPDIKTIIVPLPKVQAFDIALTAARDLGWKIVATSPTEGRIEATDTTYWYGFKDDIVIRVVAAENRTLVDIRSASREGISDVGANAERIRKFLATVSSRFGTRGPGNEGKATGHK
jgi:hypothetical protein